MYCPQCGVESSSSQPYCRSCGANLRVIAKAVTLSEAVARADRGPLPKIKGLIQNLHVEHATDEVTQAMEQVNQEIVSSLETAPPQRHWLPWKRAPLTAQERRERALVSGIKKSFTGLGLMVFLYHFASAIALKLPPSVIAEIPVELDPLVRMIWIIGTIPVFSGIGQIVGGLLIRAPRGTLPPAATAESLPPSTGPAGLKTTLPPSPESVTDHTTELLRR